MAAIYAAVVSDPPLAVTAAHVHFAVAAEVAEARTTGSGSFVPAFLDAFDTLDAAAIRDRARFEASPPER